MAIQSLVMDDLFAEELKALHTRSLIQALLFNEKRTAHRTVATTIQEQKTDRAPIATDLWPV